MFSSQRMAQNTASILSERRRLGSWFFFFFLDSGPEKSVLGYEKIKANKIYLTYYVRITCILPFVEVRWPMSWF